MATLGRQIVYLVSNFSKVKPRMKRLYLFHLRFYFFIYMTEREREGQRKKDTALTVILPNTGHHVY